jgi:hypothetical protein
MLIVVVLVASWSPAALSTTCGSSCTPEDGSSCTPEDGSSCTHSSAWAAWAPVAADRGGGDNGGSGGGGGGAPRGVLQFERRLKTLDEAAIMASRQQQNTSTRHVRWYMASGAQTFEAFNEEWLDDPLKRAAITGVYACCNFWFMDASGNLTIDSAGRYSGRFAPFLKRGLTVHATGMLNEAAIKSGAALKAIPQLVEFVDRNLLDGVMSDYEPLDESLEHAQAYAHFLAAAAKALHAIPGRRREIGMNIADWTILGPGYWHLYMAAGVDFMGSMTPTYSENARNWP